MTYRIETFNMGRWMKATADFSDLDKAKKWLDEFSYSDSRYQIVEVSETVIHSQPEKISWSFE